MQSIGGILYAYFVCDAISRRRPMSPAEARAARASWDAVRAAHLVEEERAELRAGDERRERALDVGARRYAAWAADNPEKVEALRRMAEPGGRRASV
jgi:hypothetical protein